MIARLFVFNLAPLLILLNSSPFCLCYNPRSIPPPPPNSEKNLLLRRDVIFRAVAGASSLLLPSAVYAIDPSKKDFLSDLPPLASDSTRIFFCRHGETENNRLGKIQGSRIDPPLNPTGQSQAHAMGEALSSQQPTRFFHSPLLRAQQTARIAGASLRPLDKPSFHVLPQLSEIDFGESLEGSSVSEYRAKITATYGTWAAGNWKARMGNGGETGQQVLDRAQLAIASMLKYGDRSVVAVAHSSYLRVMLSYVGGVSLAQAATWKIRNCSIHVADFDRTSTKSKLVRISEDRHLDSIAEMVVT